MTLDTGGQGVRQVAAVAAQFARMEVFEIDRVRDAEPRGRFGDRSQRARRSAVDEVGRLRGRFAHNLIVRAAVRANRDADRHA